MFAAKPPSLFFLFSATLAVIKRKAASLTVVQCRKW